MGYPQTISRMEKKINKIDSCWIWTGSKSRNGYYGSVWPNGKTRLAHRVMYEAHKGEIPQGKEIDHICKNKMCVNPNHLEAVSHRENMLRANAGWACRIKTHCPKGHEYIPENTRIKNGSRNCKVCESIYNKKRWAESKNRAALAKVKT